MKCLVKKNKWNWKTVVAAFILSSTTLLVAQNKTSHQITYIDEPLTKESLFANKLLATWPSAYHVEILDAKLVSSRFAITRPPRTWMPLLQLRGQTFEGKPYNHCLYYLVPYQSKIETVYQPGLIKVVDVLPEENCQDKFVRESFAFLGGVESFYIYMAGPSVRDYESEYLPPNHLAMRFFYNGESKKIFIPLHNVPSEKFIGQEKKTIGVERDLRVHSTSSSKLFNGIHVGPVFKSKMAKESDKSVQSIWIDVPYKNESAHCFILDDQCRVLDVAFPCSQCLGIAISANARGCNQGFHRLCGQGPCGEKDAPACPRGLSYLATDLNEDGIPNKVIKEPCSNSEESGFCREGLKPFCDERGIQICL